jgi:GntR family transcriptional regulator, sialic acid-inducible nan operon repressor
MENADNHSILPSTPLRRAKLHEIVTQKLEELIRTGGLKPGDRLPSERDIMVAFNIGRPAVREALLSLQNKGLIVTENGRRATVSQPSVDTVFTALDSVVGIIINNTKSLKNLFDARVFIEVAMARNAANGIDEDRLGELKEALEANKSAIGDRARFMQTDTQFHRILFLVADNPVFEGVHKALGNWLMERWGKINRDTSTETIAYQGHLQIYKAISHHDPDAAEKAMRKHLASSWRVWASQLHGSDQ